MLHRTASVNTILKRYFGLKGGGGALQDETPIFQDYPGNCSYSNCRTLTGDWCTVTASRRLTVVHDLVLAADTQGH